MGLGMPLFCIANSGMENFPGKSRNGKISKEIPERENFLCNHGISLV